MLTSEGERNSDLCAVQGDAVPRINERRHFKENSSRFYERIFIVKKMQLAFVSGLLCWINELKSQEHACRGVAENLENAEYVCVYSTSCRLQKFTDGRRY